MKVKVKVKMKMKMKILARGWLAASIRMDERVLHPHAMH